MSTSRKLTKGQFFASCIWKWASSEIYFVNFHSRLFFFLHFYWSILDLQYLLVSVAPQNQLRCLVPRSCPTLCGPHDCSPPGSSVRGICQARILKWIVISSPGDLPDPRIKPVSPAFAGGFFTTEPPGKPELYINKYPHFFSIFSYRSFTEYWVELLGPCSRSLLVTTATHTHTHTVLGNSLRKNLNEHFDQPHGSVYTPIPESKFISLPLKAILDLYLIPSSTILILHRGSLFKCLVLQFLSSYPCKIEEGTLWYVCRQQD